MCEHVCLYASVYICVCVCVHLCVSVYVFMCVSECVVMLSTGMSLWLPAIGGQDIKGSSSPVG